MPRQNRRRELEPLRPLSGAVTERVQWQGSDYLVRPVAGASALKTYRCPGCDGEIPPGVAHVVSWPDAAVMQSTEGAAHRRHWHTGCWGARDTRRPTSRR